MVDAFGEDHDGECKQQMTVFLKCLKENQDDNQPCKQLSKEYLQCRMDKNLMAKDDFNNLGFTEKSMNYERKSNGEENRKESEGFVAGLGVKGSNKWNWWK